MSDVAKGLVRALADRYRIERELGAGGMATVYLAEDLKHKRKVAVKVLKAELAAVLGAGVLNDVARDGSLVMLVPAGDGPEVRVVSSWSSDVRRALRNVVTP